MKKFALKNRPALDHLNADYFGLCLLTSIFNILLFKYIFANSAYIAFFLIEIMYSLLMGG